MPQCGHHIQHSSPDDHPPGMLQVDQAETGQEPLAEDVSLGSVGGLAGSEVGSGSP